MERKYQQDFDKSLWTQPQTQGEFNTYIKRLESVNNIIMQNVIVDMQNDEQLTLGQQLSVNALFRFIQENK